MWRQSLFYGTLQGMHKYDKHACLALPSVPKYSVLHILPCKIAQNKVVAYLCIDTREMWVFIYLGSDLISRHLFLLLYCYIRTRYLQVQRIFLIHHKTLNHVNICRLCQCINKLYNVQGLLKRQNSI